MIRPALYALAALALLALNSPSALAAPRYAAAATVTHNIKSPRDSASGLATGKRQHKPMLRTTPKTDFGTTMRNGLLKADATKKPSP